MSQLLSKVTVASCSYSSNVQCIHLAAVRRTLKCVVTEVVLFSIVAFNKFENQSIFDEIKAYKTKGVSFFGPPCKGDRNTFTFEHNLLALFLKRRKIMFLEYEGYKD